MVALVTICLAQDVVVDGATGGANYIVSGCGEEVPGSKATRLISLLKEIRDDLPTIHAEANTGTSSPYGFKSFFSSNMAITTVTSTFLKLSELERIPINGELKTITFVCLEPDNPETLPIYNQLIAQQPRGAGYNNFGTEIIYILPFFFKELLRSPEPYRCPIFRRSRIPAINGDDILSSSQYGILIHELIDKYLHLDHQNDHEAYDLRDCIRLSQERQVQNAANYDMFAAGESILLTSCSKSPKVQRSYQGRLHGVSQVAGPI